MYQRLFDFIEKSVKNNKFDIDELRIIIDNIKISERILELNSENFINVYDDKKLYRISRKDNTIFVTSETGLKLILKLSEDNKIIFINFNNKFKIIIESNLIVLYLLGFFKSYMLVCMEQLYEGVSHHSYRESDYERILKKYSQNSVTAFFVHHEVYNEFGNCMDVFKKQLYYFPDKNWTIVVPDFRDVHFGSEIDYLETMIIKSGFDSDETMDERRSFTEPRLTDMYYSQREIKSVFNILNS